MQYRILIASLFVLLVTTGWAQEGFKNDRAFKKFIRKQVKTSEKIGSTEFVAILPAEQCQAELRILKRSLEEAQTTLYRYASKEQVDSAFNAAYMRCSQPIAYIDYIREIARIQNLIACGHSGWSHSQLYANYRSEHLRILPFTLAYNGSECTVVGNYTTSHVEPKEGFKINSINGRSIPDLLEEIKTYLPRDGKSNDASTTGIIDFFPMAYANFIETPDTFYVEFAAPGDEGTPETIAVEARLLSEIREAQKAGNSDDEFKPLNFYVWEKDNLALFDIESFRNERIKASGQSFEHFTDSVFSELRTYGIDHLFIDLRGNTGGWTANGSYLMSYLIDKEIPYLKVETNKTGDFGFERILTYYPGYPNESVLELQENDLYEWTNYPSGVVSPQDHHQYKGKVIILTDNMSRSCSGVFSSLMREHTDALFMGEETGTASCGSGGIVAVIQLPYSGVHIHFSTVKYTCMIEQTDNQRGVLPDLPFSSASPAPMDWILYIERYMKSPYSEKSE